jgi:hypothetical protein
MDDLARARDLRDLREFAVLDVADDRRPHDGRRLAVN